MYTLKRFSITIVGQCYQISLGIKESAASPHKTFVILQTKIMSIVKEAGYV